MIDFTDFTRVMATKRHQNSPYWIVICCRTAESQVQLLNPPSYSLFVYRQSSLCQFVKSSRNTRNKNIKSNTLALLTKLGMVNDPQLTGYEIL